MINRYSPLQPNPRDEAKKTNEETKPNKPPSNENFRKLKDKRPDKNDEEMAAAVEEHEEPPSLFDLSKAAKNKKPGTSAGKSSLKDASSNEVRSTPPGTAKQDISEDEGSSAAAPFEEEAEPLTKPAPPSGPLPLKAEGPPPKMGKPQTQAPQSSAPTPSAPQTTAAQPLTTKRDPQAMDLQKPEQAAAAMSAQQKVKGAGEKTSLETGKPGQDFKKQKTDKRDKTKGEGRAEAKGDPAAGVINAGVSAASFQTEKLAETQEPLRTSTIQEIAEEIVGALQTLRQGDETKTMITLRNPPILDGATITLTTTDNAKRQVNIAFANLSPDAKMLLDRKLKEDSLTQTLDRKGITVHMLTTTTQAEQPLAAQAGQSFRERQQEGQQQQQQQGREGKEGRQKKPGSDEEELG